MKKLAMRVQRQCADCEGETWHGKHVDENGLITWTCETCGQVQAQTTVEASMPPAVTITRLEPKPLTLPEEDFAFHTDPAYSPAGVDETCEAAVEAALADNCTFIDCASLQIGEPVTFFGPANLAPADPTAALIDERHTTHGDYHDTSGYARVFKDVAAWNQTSYSNRDLGDALRMNDRQRESYDLICTKLARILAGNPHEEEHWRDIEGYARLARADYRGG